MRLTNGFCQVLKNTPTAVMDKQMRILSTIQNGKTEACVRKLTGSKLNHASVY